MPTISIDFFGNLSAKPFFWQELLKFAKEDGIKIYVISGPWPDIINRKLTNLGFVRKIHYDGVYSILSHLAGKGLDTWYDEDYDSWYSTRNDWWTAKAEICQDMGCKMHFDNDLRFSTAFENVATRFVHTLNPDNGKLIDQWYRDLKLANTYDDWENDYMSMLGGVVPM